MRGDQIYPAGVLRLGDIILCFPFEDPCVVITLTGRALLSALENSVSKLPAQEGRFCQVSGLQFGYDPNRKEGDRVRWVKVGGQELEMERRYSCATRSYMARGKDGFDSLNVKNADVEEVINEEHGILLSMVIRQYFLSLKVLSRWRRGKSICGLFTGLQADQTRRGSLIPRLPPEPTKERPSVDTSEEEDNVAEMECSSLMKEEVNLEEEKRLFELKKRVARKWETLAKIGRNIRRNGAADVGVDWCRSVRPQVEGRINIVSP